LLIATITTAAATGKVDAVDSTCLNFPVAARVLCHATAIIGAQDVYASAALVLDADCAYFCLKSAFSLRSEKVHSQRLG
jgi:hypothetical protein